MGLALGYCGMSLADFRALSPGEFLEVLRGRDRAEHAAWERARIVGVMSAQPFAGKALGPHKVLPLPWDEKPAAAAPTQTLTKEQRRQRARKLLANG